MMAIIIIIMIIIMMITAVIVEIKRDSRVVEVQKSCC